MNHDDITSQLRRILEWAEQPDPAAKPLAEYHAIANLPVRQVQQALLTIEDEPEYQRIEHFYTNELRTGHDLEQRLNRSNTEFKFLREYCGLTQHELASRLGVSIGTERRWESKDETYTPSRNAWQTIDSLHQETDREAHGILDAFYERFSDADPEEMEGGTVQVHMLPAKAVTLYLFDNQEDYEEASRTLTSRFAPDRQADPEANRFQDLVNRAVLVAHKVEDTQPREWMLEYLRAELQYGAYLTMTGTPTHTRHNAIMRVAYMLAQMDRERFMAVHISNGATLLSSDSTTLEKETQQ